MWFELHGEDTKNIWENSSNSFSNEIFKDGLNSPECAKIFFDCLKQIESNVKKLLQLHEESKNAQFKVTESVQHLSDIFDDMEKENKKRNEKISKLEEWIKNLESENKGFLVSINEIEQYSHRNCLLLHGIKEKWKEDTDDVVIKS